MIRIFLILFLLFASPLKAQEKKFIVSSPCDSNVNMLEIVRKYGETLLFTGEGMQFSAMNGQPYVGSMFFFTNQDTGTFTILQGYPDNTACLVLNGRNFVPYSGPQPATPKDDL
jgi:hypothetical protein